MEGWLLVKNMKNPQSEPSKRYVVLGDRMLYNYQSEKTSHCVGKISLESIRDVEVVDNLIVIYTDYGQNQYIGSTYKESYKWCEEIRVRVDELKNPKNPKKFRKNQMNGTENGKSVEKTESRSSKKGRKKKFTENSFEDIFEKTRMDLLRTQQELETTTNQLKDSEYKVEYVDKFEKEMDVLKEKLEKQAMGFPKLPQFRKR